MGNAHSAEASCRSFEQSTQARAHTTISEAQEDSKEPAHQLIAAEMGEDPCWSREVSSSWRSGRQSNIRLSSDHQGPQFHIRGHPWSPPHQKDQEEQRHSFRTRSMMLHEAERTHTGFWARDLSCITTMADPRAFDIDLVVNLVFLYGISSW